MCMPAIAMDQTALMLAAHAGYSLAVETLIAHRAKLNITAKFGLSALMLAIIAGHTEVASLLARAGPISPCGEPEPLDSQARLLMILLKKGVCWSYPQN